MSQQEVNKVAEKYELPLITSLIVKPNELDSVDESYYPLVVKGISKDVVHKSELNAVKLNIKTKEELHKAAEEISESFKSHNYEVEEYLVQKFVKTKHEVLVGGFRDPSFGPMLMFGTGGKYVEVINDTSMKSAYLCEADIDDMINSTKMGELLKGVRGEAPANLPSLKKIIKSAAMMMIENKNIEEFDFNPLIIDEDGEIYAVDIRIKVN
ncbi:MAG: acetate--CoA ligase family protein [Rhodothermaceae bacterium]